MIPLLVSDDGFLVEPGMPASVKESHCPLDNSEKDFFTNIINGLLK